LLDAYLHPVGFGERLEHESNTSQPFIRVTKHRIAHTALKYGMASCGILLEMIAWVLTE